MKFFIPLSSRYGKDSDPCSRLGSVYGPYENDKVVEDVLARLWPNDKKQQFLVLDGQIVNVTPSAKEKPENEKRAPGNMDNYVRNGEDYMCKDCGGSILGTRVAHPIHLHEMSGGGFGECRYETIPYCPNWEKKPNVHGEPVYAQTWR